MLIITTSVGPSVGSITVHDLIVSQHRSEDMCINTFAAVFCNVSVRSDVPRLDSTIHLAGSYLYAHSVHRMNLADGCGS